MNTGCDIYMRNIVLSFNYVWNMYVLDNPTHTTHIIVVIQCETGIFINDTMYYYSRSGPENVFKHVFSMYIHLIVSFALDFKT